MASSSHGGSGVLETLLPLLLANALTLAVAELRGFGPIELLWPFWFQNLWIGLARARRIRNLRDFSTAGLSIGGRPVDPSPENAARIARFFLLHYGFFHLVYLLFLLAFTFATEPDGTIEVTNTSTGESYPLFLGRIEAGDWVAIGVLAAVFALAELGEGRQGESPGRKPNLGTLMFMAYLRIVPMHLTIILAMFLGAQGAVWLFLALKTLVESATVYLMRRLEGG